MNQKARALAVVAFAASTLVSCGSSAPSGLDESSLQTLNCQPAELPDYYSQNEGTYTVGNMAGLAEDGPAREAELRDLGMQGGFFTFWREAVGRPPFDPPASVVCELVQFDDPGGAEGFVDLLEADPASLASVGLTWLPGDDASAEELSPSSNAPAGARTFIVEGSHEGVRTIVAIVFAPAAEYVVGVYAAAQDRQPDTALAEGAASATVDRVLAESR